MTTSTSQAARLRFEALARAHAERAWRLAHSLMPRREDAEDLLQHSLLHIAQRADAIPEGNPWPWLAAVMTNCARNQWRYAGRRKMASLDVDVDTDRSEAGTGTTTMQIPDHRHSSPDELLADQELAESLRDGLWQLPEGEREVISLCYLGDLTQAEVSESLGIPLGTVKSRCRLGLQRLRESLRDRELSDAALTRSIGLLPFAAPAGGLDVALDSWIGSISSSVFGASSTVSVAGALAGGSVMSGKTVIIGSCVMVALGIGVGAIGQQVLNGDPKPNEYEAFTPGPENPSLTRLRNELESSEARRERLDREYASLIARFEATEQRSLDLGNQLAGVQSENARLLKELRQRSETDTQTASTESATGPTSGDAESLVSKVKAAIASGDKAATLAGMKALSAMGEPALKHYFDAFAEFIKHGNPDSGGKENSLNVSYAEFEGVMSIEQRHYALANRDVNRAARIYAAYWLPWEMNTPLQDRQSMLIDMLREETDPTMLDASMRGLIGVGHPDLPTLLVEFAGRQDAPEQSRVAALKHLSKEIPDKADWQAIAALQSDGNAFVAGAARVYVLRRTPQVSGLLVVSSKLTEGVTDAGLGLGDVILRFDGKAVTSPEELTKWMAATPAGSKVVVEVWRLGESLAPIVNPADYALVTELLTKRE